MTHWFSSPETPPRVLTRCSALSPLMRSMLGELASLENPVLLAGCDFTGHVWWARRVVAP